MVSLHMLCFSGEQDSVCDTTRTEHISVFGNDDQKGQLK